MRNLDSGFPPPIRSRACFHGNDRGKDNPEAKILLNPDFCTATPSLNTVIRLAFSNNAYTYF